MEEFQTGLLYCGNNLTVMPQLPRGKIDLIYIDPPFFSSRFYEVIYGDTREVRAFEDRWKGGINHYVGWLADRIRWMWELLSPRGSIYVHLDPHAVHYVKIQMDDIFGASQFRNEIIWKRTSAHSSAKRWGPNFDTILFYTKTDEYTWNPQKEPHDPAYVDRFYRVSDAKGKFRLSDLTGAGIRHGASGASWRGVNPGDVGRHWAVPREALQDIPSQQLRGLTTQEKLNLLDQRGRVYWPEDGHVPAYKRYWDEVSEGVPLQAVWTDIPPIGARAKERQGYPTQKPESLLRRIIEASSNKGDVVADFFCGCGTTLAVAQSTQRRWIGCDVSPTALKVVRRRLEKLGATDPKLVNYPYTLEELKDMAPLEFENYVIDFVNGTHAGRADDKRAIDGFTFFNANPIQVKQQEHVGGDIVQRLAGAVEGKGKPKGYIFALGFSRYAYEEAARIKSDRGVEVELVLLQDAVQQEPQPEFS